jgi:PEP-CTERM motif
MKRGLLLLFSFLVFGLLAVTVSAAPIPLGNGITVTCQMSDGSACTPAGNLTWSIPEVPGDTAPQLGIALFFNVPFVTTGAFNILDASVPGVLTCLPGNYSAACISDQVSFLNFAQNNNNGVVDLFSDPNQNILALTNLPVGCQEDANLGCSYQFNVQTSNGVVAFVVFSDGNNTSTTSDTIQILTPEPASDGMVLMGIGLSALGWKRRR